jgi:hypothetical protein
VIDSIKVEWKGKQPEYFTGVSVNRIIRIIQGQGIIGILQQGTEIPKGFNLHQNYPNPFNPSTTIKFDIPAGIEDPAASLVIYDVSGRQAAVLMNGPISPGKYEAVWDASQIASGVYFYTLRYGSLTQTRKMILLK